ncbi:thioesterase family protein [Sagittula sp. NFXS13]|uniref:Acyl-CoA thioesterase FadM n=1 Tax=Sagittula marina TaxID=943940 RepID=A0A7W6DNH0_9RHOB|nr:acyl-CoA thioesterase [Sagittula marina]MBB3983820.1 acyl-CoA thioesterase FadM [Sagittula marina]
MYPFFRLFKDMWKARSAAPMGLFDTHISHHMCMPWDLDMWNELNNGRTLTLYDLGRIPMGQRMGLMEALKRERWGLTVAGSVVRYRRRVRGLDRIEVQSRVIGWDRRFVYIEQSMWKTNGDCSSQIVLRTAITDANGIVTVDRLAKALGVDMSEAPELPAWVSKWIEAEDLRPWPPHREV